MQMNVRLGNPAVVFIYSLSLLLLGCAIGIHWKNSPGMAIWISICGALLMVIHDLLEGFAWIGILGTWTRILHDRERK